MEPVSVIQVARLLARTEERLGDTERQLIGAVRRTIQVTESMIALVRTTTTTTHTLMAPLRRADGGAAGCEGLGRCTRKSLHCACQRVAMAKDLVRVVEGLNHTAGSLNEATDTMIKLSNSLSPREDLDCSCADFLGSRAEAAEAALRGIFKVQRSLESRVQSLRTAAEALEAGEDAAGSVPERDQAAGDLRAMMESAGKAVDELTATTLTLGGSVGFLQEVLRRLQELRSAEVCPEAGGALLDQLECPVCYQTTPPLWACCHGHVVCAACRPGVLTCPSCRGPLPPRPALLLTAWASGLRAWCAYRHRGCTALLRLAGRAKHHEACEHRGAAAGAEVGAEAGQDDGSRAGVPPCRDRDTGKTIPVSETLAAAADPEPSAPPAEEVAPAAAPSPAAAAAAHPPDPVQRSRGDPEEAADSYSDPRRKRLRSGRRSFPCCVA